MTRKCTTALIRLCQIGNRDDVALQHIVDEAAVYVYAKSMVAPRVLLN